MRRISKKVAKVKASKVKPPPSDRAFTLPFERNVFHTQFTAEKRAEILERVRQGMHPFNACVAAGVNPRTVHNWREFAQAGKPEYAAFFEAMLQAATLAQERLRMYIELAARGQKVPGGKGT